MFDFLQGNVEGVDGELESSIRLATGSGSHKVPRLLLNIDFLEGYEFRCSRMGTLQRLRL